MYGLLLLIWLNQTTHCLNSKFVDYQADVKEFWYDLIGLRKNVEKFNGHQEDINFGFVYPWFSDASDNHVIIYGRPNAFPNYFNILTAFPVSIWLSLMLVTGSFIMLFNVLLLVYTDCLGQHELVKSGTKKLDVTLKVVATLTEPDAFDIFPVWSTVKQSTLNYLIGIVQHCNIENIFFFHIGIQFWVKIKTMVR